MTNERGKKRGSAHNLKAVAVSELVDEVAKPAELVAAERVRRRDRPREVLGSQISAAGVAPPALRRLLAVLRVPAVLDVESLKGKNCRNE